MYITQLEHWEHKDWKKCLWDNRIDMKYLDSIKAILTSETKEEIEESFSALEYMGVINGIGAEWMGKYIVGFISALFKGVRFEWHDISYLLGGTKKDKLKADYGLFKYSIVSIVENYKKLNSLDVIFIFKELIILLYTPFAFIKTAIILIFWRILVYFGNRAFRFTY